MTVLTDDDVNEIVRILSGTTYDNLLIKTAAVELTVRRSHDGWTQEWATRGEPKVIGSTRADTPKAAENKAFEADVPGLVSVRAPMVGTFYRAPKPGAPPFVAEGAAVDANTVIGIVETMKLMNSISAGAAGRVAEILVTDGTLVEAGQPLMWLKP